jgi:ankyrin repeat protein
MRSVNEILMSLSDVMFPEDLGEHIVTIDSRSYDGDTPLHVLLWRGDVDGLKALILDGAEVDAIDSMGETPLHIAVSKELPDAIRALLAAGANPDIRSNFGRTAHDIAVTIGGTTAQLLV